MKKMRNFARAFAKVSQHFGPELYLHALINIVATGQEIVREI